MVHHGRAWERLGPPKARAGVGARRGTYCGASALLPRAPIGTGMRACPLPTVLAWNRKLAQCGKASLFPRAVMDRSPPSGRARRAGIFAEPKPRRGLHACALAGAIARPEGASAGAKSAAVGISADADHGTVRVAPGHRKLAQRGMWERGGLGRGSPQEVAML